MIRFVYNLQYIRNYNKQRKSSQVKLILSPKQRAKPKTSARKTGSSMPQ